MQENKKIIIILLLLFFLGLGIYIFIDNLLSSVVLPFIYYFAKKENFKTIKEDTKPVDNKIKRTVKKTIKIFDGKVSEKQAIADVKKETDSGLNWLEIGDKDNER